MKRKSRLPSARPTSYSSDSSSSIETEESFPIMTATYAGHTRHSSTDVFIASKLTLLSMEQLDAHACRRIASPSRHSEALRLDQYRNESASDIVSAAKRD